MKLILNFVLKIKQHNKYYLRLSVKVQSVYNAYILNALL